ncbi:glycosyl hydrolase family 18 protein [Aliarcobacter butzleri]|uniref:glycosyl hydrolase family 18 protein n=1 Tax=Aliarcobacter butzleri TaxID=28197 RepID=UPI001EDAC915|nr:glycosyl hydrolase family 18 protein [Aliarcobacter butzleri]MCG3660229.1 glycosyl hydrolase family 18 protein [Aliarcobacter butzleri]
MKKIVILISLILVFALIVFNYNKTQKKDIQISFYSWENSFEEQNINEKLYIKVLDINFSTKLELLKTNIKETPKNFIPVIYITNETMKNVDYSLVSKAILETLKNYKFDEIQIDCDWSSSTRSNYFNLLEDLKEKLNKKISATIRLHQIKYYTKTGIPPVDYGVLMYYNMSNIGDFNTKNSILDNEIAKKYHYNFDVYPLKLKLALPLYSQAIQFREEKAISLFEGVEEKDFNNDFEKLENNRYKVLNSHYFKGRYIYKDDIFRLENSNEQDIKIALKDFLDLSKNRYDEVIFYTLKYKNKYDLNNLIKGNL